MSSQSDATVPESGLSDADTDNVRTRVRLLIEITARAGSYRKGLLKSAAKLSPQDQPLAKAQQFCAVMNQSRLGSMGTPIKFEIKGEPVFVCCSGCKAKALKNPDETLAKVAALKAGNTAAQ